MLQRFLLGWLCISSFVAYVWPIQQLPDIFTLGGATLPYVICGTMFCIGWLLPRNELRELARRWPIVLLGTTVQYLTMPTLAFLMTRIVPMNDDLRLGVMLVGCVPGAMASNVLTLMAKGNVSYSLSLTTSATLLSPICVPLTLWFFLCEDMPGPAFGKTAYFLGWTVLLPTILGHLVGHRLQEYRPKFNPFAKAIASLAILWIISVVVGKNRESLSELTSLVFAAAIALNLLGYATGMVAGSAMRLSESMRRALVLEIGMQNAGLGATLASQIYQDRPSISIPTALYTFLCMFTGTMLARWWSRRPPAEPDSTTIDCN